MKETIRGKPAGWLTEVSYEVDGIPYEAVVEEYLVGNEAPIYVNPEDPADVVGKQGARIRDLAKPLIAAVGSGLFAIVLLLIALSPKED